MTGSRSAENARGPRSCCRRSPDTRCRGCWPDDCRQQTAAVGWHSLDEPPLPPPPPVPLVPGSPSRSRLARARRSCRRSVARLPRARPAGVWWSRTRSPAKTLTPTSIGERSCRLLDSHHVARKGNQSAALLLLRTFRIFCGSAQRAKPRRVDVSRKALRSIRSPVPALVRVDPAAPMPRSAESSLRDRRSWFHGRSRRCSAVPAPPRHRRPRARGELRRCAIDRVPGDPSNRPVAQRPA